MDEWQMQGFKVYRASWRAGLGWAVGTLGIVGMGFGLGALQLRLEAPAVFLWTACICMLGLAWLMGRPLWDGRPAVAIGAPGLASFQFKGHVIPWQEIAEIGQQSVQGEQHWYLELRKGAASVAATRSWLVRGTRRNIPLVLLAKADRVAAEAELLRAFHQHASGHAHAALQRHVDEAAAVASFDEAARRRVPRAWALWGVVALNIGVWLFNLAAGLSAFSPSAAELFHWGANSAYAVVHDGEHWRLLTATFLHGGILHLALNMVALWGSGQQVCRWYGNGQFLLIYLVSALTGSALGLHFGAQQTVSVGASGAVFGVFGALLVAIWQHRGQLPPQFAKRLLTSQGTLIVLMLMQGFGRAGIDNAAHVGGLVAGMVMGGVLLELVDAHATPARLRRHQALAVGVAAALVGGLVWMAPVAGLDHRQVFAEAAVLQSVQVRLATAQRALHTDAQAVKAGTLSEAQLVEAIEQRHLPAYQAIHGDLSAPDKGTGSALWTDLRAVTGDMAELMATEVAKARGTLDATTADRRIAALGGRLEETGARFQALQRASAGARQK